MKRRLTILSIFLVIFFLSCDEMPSEKNEKIQIYTSIFPVYDIVNEITPEKYEIHYAVPIGANPHTFEPTPDLVVQLKSADYFIGIDPHFDGWITQFLHPDTKIFYLNQDSNKAEHSHHHHDPPHFNPHLWLSISRIRDLVPQISQELSGQYNADKNELLVLGKEYQTKLDSTKQIIQKMFENIPDNKFIQWHDAWDAFAKENHLEIIGTLEHGHGDMPSIKEFNQLVNKAKVLKVKTIVVGLNVQNPTLNTLKKTLDGNVIRLDTLGDPKIPERSTYIKLMINNATLLANAFKK